MVLERIPVPSGGSRTRNHCEQLQAHETVVHSPVPSAHDGTWRKETELVFSSLNLKSMPRYFF